MAAADSLRLAPSSCKQVHVLFLIDQLCGKGGAETAILRLTQDLPPEQFRATVITFRMDRTLPMLGEFCCPVHEFRLRRTYGWSAAQTAMRLGNFIRREKVDLVHTLFPSADLWGGTIAKLTGVPVISNRRDLGILRKAHHRQAYRVLRRLPDHVVTVSNEVREVCIQRDGILAARVSTIYNAVEIPSAADQRDLNALRRKLGLPVGAPLITTVANLRWIKGVDVVLHAASTVKKSFPQACFVIAGGTDPGEPDLLPKLKNLSREFGLDGQVFFVGTLESVTELLQASDIFCLLSRSEGFSSAILEAMACALPCIVTHVGGNSEAVIDGESGYLVNSEDHVAAAWRICELLGDSQRRHAMGRRGQKRVTEQFSRERMTSQWVAMYRRVLRSRGADQFNASS